MRIPPALRNGGLNLKVSIKHEALFYIAEAGSGLETKAGIMYSVKPDRWQNG